jgi:hypothetical protein
MAKRRSLDDLVSEASPLEAPAELPQRVPDAGKPARAAAVGEAAAGEPAAPGRAARQPARARRTTPELTESQTPKWQELERKELRLRPGQLDELARLRRLLNRQRAGAGERITENTLIRVAVDLLLASSGQLAGATEDELRDSVTHRVRKSAAS